MKRTSTYSLYRKTKTRVINLTAAAVLLASSIGGALPLVFASSANAAPSFTELRLSQNPATSVEAGTGTTIFKAKEVLKVGSLWTNFVALKAPTTLTATVTNGQISTDCATWGTSATVTIPVTQVVEGSFCYQGGGEDASNSVTVTSSISRLIGSNPITDTLSVSIPVVDTVAPAVPTLNFPANGVYRASADTNHSDWDAVTDVDGVTYNYESAYDLGFTNLAYGPSSTGSDTTILNPGEPAGTYYWRVQACDMSAAQNCSEWSEPWAINIDNTLPVVSLTAPTDGTTVHGSHVKVRGSASDNDGLATCTLSVYSASDTTTALATYDCPTGNFSNQLLATFDTTNGTYPDGDYVLTLNATDLAGNTAAPDSRTFTVDNTPPTVTAYPGYGLINGHQQFTVCITDNNALKHSDNKSVIVYLENSNGSHAQVGTVNLSHNSGCDTVTFNTNKLKDGSAKLVVGQVTDAEGNTTDSTTFDEYTVDNTAPNLHFTNSFPTPTTIGPIVGVHAWDKNGVNDITIHVYKVTSHGPKLVKTCETNDGPIWDELSIESYNPNGQHLNCGIAYLKDGTYFVTATATDTAGNESDPINSGNFVIDSTAPTTPVATPGAGTYTFAPVVTLTSTDAGSGVASIYYTTDGSTPSKTNGTLYTGAFNIGSSETIKAIAYDYAGNASGVLVAPYVVNIPVAAPTSSPTSGSKPPVTVFGSGDTTPTTDILSTSTTAPNTQGKVKGDKITKHVSDKKSSNFLGLGWWWLLVLAAVLGFIWFILAKRRNDDEE